MKNREMSKNKANIIVSRKIKEIHPVVDNIVNNLAEIDPIKFIKISPDFLQASSETTKNRLKIPITKPEHHTHRYIFDHQFCLQEYTIL